MVHKRGINSKHLSPLALKGQKLCYSPGVLTLLPLQGDNLAHMNHPGRCPGLGASALSGRVGTNQRGGKPTWEQTNMGANQHGEQTNMGANQHGEQPNMGNKPTWGTTQHGYYPNAMVLKNIK